jgi:hypothetical protein
MAYAIPAKDRRKNMFDNIPPEQIEMMATIAKKYGITARECMRLYTIMILNGYSYNQNTLNLFKCVIEQMEYIDKINKHETAARNN